jgi:hypothetical protein
VLTIARVCDTATHPVETASIVMLVERHEH